MKIRKQLFRTLAFGLSFMLAATYSCKEEVFEPPVASFQYEQSETNYLEITFTSFSLNAVSWSWDFGDGGSSTEENPTHTYAAEGTYTVTLTATNGGGETSTKEEVVEIVNPDALKDFITGETGRTWILQREGVALGVGPNPGDVSWWNFGGVTPLHERPCILDDEYLFSPDGSFTNNTNNTFFMDSEANGGWNDDVAADDCLDESTAGAFDSNTQDLANGGDYSFEVNNQDNTLILNGSGAYIALPSKVNETDNYQKGSALPTTRTFLINRFAEGPEADTLQLVMQYPNAAGTDGFGNWTFNLVSYKAGATVPDIPQPPAEPTANFGVSDEGLVATFTDFSSNAVSYSWDFGGEGSSTEQNPTFTFSAEGFYEVTLTVTSAGGLTSSQTQTVAVGTSTITAADLASDAGKAWSPVATIGTYRVGPSAGSGEWYAVPKADVEARECFLDDEFIFTTDGSYEVDTKGALFAESYMGGANECVNDGDLTAPYDAFASSADYTFTFTPADETSNAEITVNGLGAFLGFNRGSNDGEYNGEDETVASTVTYEVVKFVKTDTRQRIVVSFSYPNEGGNDGLGWWTVVLESSN